MSIFLLDYRLLERTIQFIFILSIVPSNWQTKQNSAHRTFSVKFHIFLNSLLSNLLTGCLRVILGKMLSFFRHLSSPAEQFRNFISTTVWLSKALIKILKWTRTKIAFLDTSLKFDTDSSVTLFNKGCFIPINVMFLMLMSYLPYISLPHLKGLRMISKPTI